VCKNEKIALVAPSTISIRFPLPSGGKYAVP